ncbi:MAG: hypothetical protein V1902_00455 [Candidatus Falkowbacteria bacterium]
MGKAIAGTVWEVSLGKFDAAKAKLLNQLGERGAEVFERLNEDPDYCYRVAKAMVYGLQDWRPRLSADEIGTKFGRAVTILGQDFISPMDIFLGMGMTYGTDQVAMLAEMMPTEEVLKWLAANEYMLVAGPPTAMSLLDIRAKKSELFYSKTDDAWYCQQEQKFVRDDKVGEGWLALRKTVVPRSANKTWEEQQKLLFAEERVPNAAEVAWGVITYKAVRNEFLLPLIYARTSSVSADGRRVSVGDFAAAGLHVAGYWGDLHSADLGLAGARLPAGKAGKF